ncbi:chitotriosidase-1-like isoform X2 [Biomphalaria glabrata]|uniref:Chitotriosidase-1-like isoform X2 n=1 Tax=Biomphalaria glabrata TaxID=6526 RepID=A0A9W3AM14_BIOGL|nr:chitotriosidase-1-like isoform X2 [Biomphalaria glabrata]
MKATNIIFFFITFVHLSSENCNIIMCNLKGKSLKQSRLTSADIDTTVCPYLTISFAEFDNDALVVDKQVSETFPWMWVAKAKNPNFKLVLCFYNAVGVEEFYDMYRTPEKRLKFIPLLVTYLRNNKFDGVQVELAVGYGLWSPLRYNIDRWADFMEDIQKAFTEEAKSSGKPKLLLFGHIDSRKEDYDPLYHVPRIYKYSDFVIVDAWPYYPLRIGPKYNISITNTHHTRIYSEHQGDFSNIDYNVKTILRKGGIKEKTVISLYLMAEFYRRVFGLGFPRYDWVKYDNYGAVGAIMSQGGNVTRVFDNCPIFMSDRTVIYYDDEISLTEKTCLLMTLKEFLVEENFLL